MVATNSNQYRQNSRQVWVALLSTPITICRKDLACLRQGILTKTGD